MIKKIINLIRNEKEITRFFFVLLTPLMLSASIFIWADKSNFFVNGVINDCNELISFVGLLATIALATAVSFTALSREINRKWSDKEIDLFLSAEFFVNFICASVLSFVVIEQFFKTKWFENIIVLFPSMLLYLFLCTQMSKGLVVHEVGVSQYEDKNYELSSGHFKGFLAVIAFLCGTLFPAGWVLFSKNDNEGLINFLLILLFLIIPLLTFIILFIWFFSLVKSTFEAQEGELKYVTTLNGFPRFVAILLGGSIVGSSFYLPMSLFSTEPVNNYVFLSIIFYSIFLMYGFFGKGPFSAMKILLDEIEDDFNSAHRDFRYLISKFFKNLKILFSSIWYRSDSNETTNSDDSSVGGTHGRGSGDTQEMNKNEDIVFFVESEEFNSSDFKPSLIKYLNSIPEKLKGFEFRQQKATKHFFSMFYEGSRVGHLRLRKKSKDAEFRIGANYEHQNEKIMSELKDILVPGVKFETAFTDKSGAKREQFRIEFDSEQDAPSVEFLAKIFNLIKEYKR